MIHVPISHVGRHVHTVMSADNIRIEIDQQVLENVAEYDYLGHLIKLDKENQTAKITRRIGLRWAAFGKLRPILCNPSIPVHLKKKVHDTCLLPVPT